MAAVTTAPGLPRFRLNTENEGINTLPDPRSGSVTPGAHSNGTSTPTQHPDLSNEVAMLSNKLINAINHQTNLDDSLNATRHDLDQARHELKLAKDRIKRLEAAEREHNGLIECGWLVRKEEVMQESTKLYKKLAEERAARATVESQKKEIEQELESLTGALFEEANKMVSAARKDREAVEKRNEQLQSKLNDTELLLASHQEQLSDLKSVMHQMGSEKDDTEANANTILSTTPSTPALGTRDSENIGRVLESLHLSPNTPGGEPLSPACPTTFTHLLSPVLRHDLQAYEDFDALMRMGRQSAPPSRVTSGSYGGLNVSGLGSMSGASTVLSTVIPANNGSQSSLSTPGSYGSTPVTPTTPASLISNTPRRDPQPSSPLKDTRFYKRVLAEDIEPTLRLDNAPGLSWLARRTVLNCMSEGSLVVEPVPATSKLHAFACSLCGESRKDEEHARRHRFRTSENDKNAQRYPLCDYCLGRVRASCDFLGFLRMVKDGLWRADSAEGERSAWEESVRLRERMFWARMGGGVIPAFLNTRDSPRTSTNEEREDQRRESGEAVKSPLKDEVAANETVDSQLDGDNLEVTNPFRSFVKRISIGRPPLPMDTGSDQPAPPDTDLEADKTKAVEITPATPVSPSITTAEASISDDLSPPVQPSEADAEAPSPDASSTKENVEHNRGRDSLKSDSSATMTPGSRTPSANGETRLSISIPGAF